MSVTAGVPPVPSLNLTPGPQGGVRSVFTAQTPEWEFRGYQVGDLRCLTPHLRHPTPSPHSPPPCYPVRVYKWLIRLLVVGAGVGGIIVLRLTVFAPKPIEVRVVAIARGRVEETVTNSKAGTVTARRRAQLSPDIGGRVAAIERREGQAVAAGQVILRLDDSLQRASLDQAQHDLAAARDRQSQACLEADRAARELARYQDPALRQYVSASFIDQLQVAAQAAAAGCRASRAGVDAARARIDALQNEIAKTVIRAPFSGIVARLTVEVGEFITPSPPGVPIPPVVDLLDPSSLYILAPINEVDSSRIRAGQATLVTLDPFPDRKFAGHVVRVAPFVLDILEQNRTVDVEVEIDEAPGGDVLLPGTSADVEIVLSARESVLRIPTAALLEGGKVFIVRDGRLEERLVKTGLRNWEFTEITDGLAEGDQVVMTLDRTDIIAGARVTVTTEPAPR